MNHFQMNLEKKGLTSPNNFFRWKNITFQRCIQPEEATGDPILVLFSDGSENIFGTCAYARWQTESGSFVSSLIASKSRLTPLKKITIVRIELKGAVLSKRLEDFITSEGRLQFVKTYCIVDSEIVRAMIQKESYDFNTFVEVVLEKFRIIQIRKIGIGLMAS